MRLSKTYRATISARIAVFWFESRLRAFLWGIALPIALPEHITREQRIRSGHMLQSEHYF
jgi:hypothetical protein